jgi:phosphopentomutase
MNKRAIVIIIDGVGIGELPDADLYGDSGSNTLGNLAMISGGLKLPTLEKMGLGCIHPIRGVNCCDDPIASYGKMAELSPGKDSTTGHWELGGLVLNKPFPTYPNGFPKEVIDIFTKETGLKILGNYPASGTEIIKDLGEEHIKTGRPIIYTSADSVFQIAAHQEVIPLNRLYELCEISREFLSGEHAVARVIARPFIGKNRANFVRTRYRKDFSLKPRGKTILRTLYDAHIPTLAIGKISDLYANDGIKERNLTKTNAEGMQAIIDAMHEFRGGFIMANLVDFDMLWGHRNDCEGFKYGLEEFDRWLQIFLTIMRNNDICIITSDHGNDPTTPSTDHSREYVPILVTGHHIKRGVNLGTRTTFADCQATLADYFIVEKTAWGKSFLPLIYK